MTSFDETRDADAHFAQGFEFQVSEPKKAIASYQKALTLYEALAKADPTVPEYQSNLANTHYNMGILFLETDRRLEAEVSYQKALILYEAVAKADPTVPEYQSNLANTHDILGDLFGEDRSLEAEESYQEALTIREALTKAHPTVNEYQSNLANTHENLGFFLGATGRTEEAKVSFQDAEAIRAKIR